MTNTTTYAVSLRVSISVLPTLLQVIERTKGITLDRINVSEGNIPAPPPPPARKHPYANGRANKGVSGDDLILSLLAKKPKMSISELRDAYEAAGFARTSASPFASRSIQSGKVKRIWPGQGREPLFELVAERRS